MKIYWNETSKFNVPGATHALPDTFDVKNVITDANGNDLSEMLILGIDTETGEIEYFKKDDDGQFIVDSSLEIKRFLKKYPAPLIYKRKTKDELDDELEDTKEQPLWFVYWHRNKNTPEESFGLTEFKNKEAAEEFADKITTKDDQADYVLIKGEKVEELNHDAID